MKSYVLGFLFSKNKEIVWLIEKNKPEWQMGLINGIGGKIEYDELPSDAMKREFNEEAGLIIDDWKQYAVFTDKRGYEVYCYYALSDERAKTMTDEKIWRYYTNSLPLTMIPNLNWLIPMALSFENGETPKIYTITESECL